MQNKIKAVKEFHESFKLGIKNSPTGQFRNCQKQATFLI